MNEVYIIVGGFLFCFLFFGGVIAWWVYKGKQHRKAVCALADRLGFSYAGAAIEEVLRDGKDCYPFEHYGDERVKKVKRQAKHVICKHTEDDHFITACDYILSTMSRNGRWWSTSYTIVIFASPSLNLPVFWCGPQRIETVANVPGLAEEVTIDNFPDFTASHMVRGEEADAVRSLFNDRLIQLLKENPDMFLEGRPGRLLCYYRHSWENVNFSTIQDWEKLISLGLVCVRLLTK